MMDMTTPGDSDGGGCPRLFQSTSRVDRVMGDAAYDRRHRNRARGTTMETTKTTTAVTAEAKATTSGQVAVAKATMMTTT